MDESNLIIIRKLNRDLTCMTCAQSENAIWILNHTRKLQSLWGNGTGSRRRSDLDDQTHNTFNVDALTELIRISELFRKEDKS